jgi:hypothetical protein
MRLMTASNMRYYPRIRPYLDSLKRNCNVPYTLICTDEAPYPFSPVVVEYLTKQENFGAPHETESPQHGSFWQVLDDYEEAIVFTDGDLIMQRPFTPAEMAWAEGVEFSAGWNGGPGETLRIEAQRLRPTKSIDAIRDDFPLMDKEHCYNIGCMIAKGETFKRIHERYLELWSKACEDFGHMARQQWLVCYVVAELGIKVDLMPLSFHAHGHYGMPAGCYQKGAEILYERAPILFRHKL